MGSRISRLNTPWWEESTSEKQDRLFVDAMHIAREEFLIKLRDEYMREIMCEDIVTTYANKRFEIDVSGRTFEDHAPPVLCHT